MGAFAVRKLRSRVFSPGAGMLGAAFLAFVVMFPAAGEARFSARQLEVSKDCGAKLPGRGILRAAGPCKGHTLAKTMLPERMPISGNVGAALAAELYCRTSTIDVSEFTRKSKASLPHPAPRRVIEAAANMPVEWPAGLFRPAPDTGMIEALSVASIPDG